MTVDANAYLISDAVSESATPIIYGEEDVLRKVLFDAQELPQRMDNISQMAKGAGNSIQLPSELSTWSVSSFLSACIYKLLDRVFVPVEYKYFISPLHPL